MKRKDASDAKDANRLRREKLDESVGACVLECGSLLPLSMAQYSSKAPEDWRSPKPCGCMADFGLSEGENVEEKFLQPESTLSKKIIPSVAAGIRFVILDSRVVSGQKARRWAGKGGVTGLLSTQINTSHPKSRVVLELARVDLGLEMVGEYFMG